MSGFIVLTFHCLVLESSPYDLLFSAGHEKFGKVKKSRNDYFCTSEKALFERASENFSERVSEANE